MDTNKACSATLSDPTERALLDFLLSGPGRSLDELAAACKTDILTLAELILTPRLQAALDAIRRAAASLAETRALACGQVALAALSAACDQPNADPAERRRAAAALARYLPKPIRPVQTPAALASPAADAEDCLAPGQQESACAINQPTPTESAPQSKQSEQAVSPEPSKPARARDRPAPALAA